MVPNGEYTTRINGLNLWYKISGTGPVCIVPTPGWGPSSDMYFRTLTPFEDRFTLVYLDTRGAGRSEQPKRSTDYTYAHFAADLDGLRQYLKQDKIWVMGHSRAGVDALQYALTYPSACQGLILLDSLPAFDQIHSDDVQARLLERQNEPWFEDAFAAFNDRTMPESDEAFARWLLKILPFYFYDQSKLEQNRDHFAATTLSVAAWQGSSDSNSRDLNLLPRLADIHVPTLIVVGRHDFICSPLQARRLHQGIAGSTLIVIEQAGHLPWLEQPETFYRKVKQALPVLEAL
ncbi:MAG: alpha/beta hydrolase [Anaerolineae bacterium]|nr:alpha/beta hydrolase [Anaerolineae bacterium]